MKDEISQIGQDQSGDTEMAINEKQKEQEAFDMRLSCLENLMSRVIGILEKITKKDEKSDFGLLPIEKESADKIMGLYSYFAVNGAKKLYYDEVAQQSATASMFIEYNKQITSVKAIQNSLRNEITKVKGDSSILDIWLFNIKSQLPKGAITTRIEPSVKEYITGLIGVGTPMGDILPKTKDYILRLRRQDFKDDDSFNSFAIAMGCEEGDVQ